MIRADLIEFNKELFQKLNRAGIKLEDYKYCDIYRDYVEMSRIKSSRKVVILTLAQRYHISDRQIYNIVRRMQEPIEQPFETSAS